MFKSVFILVLDGWSFSCEAPLEWLSLDLTDDKSTLLHALALSLCRHHNGRDSVSNHQPHHCWLNRLFRRRSKKTSKLRATGEFSAQMASIAENVYIWWRHHDSARHQAITRVNVDPDLCCHTASLGHNVLNLPYFDHCFYADTEFLLRFLRYCKFSQLEARKRLDAYLSAVTKYADHIMDIDTTQKEVLDLVKTG